MTTPEPVYSLNLCTGGNGALLPDQRCGLSWTIFQPRLPISFAASGVTAPVVASTGVAPGCVRCISEVTAMKVRCWTSVHAMSSTVLKSRNNTAIAGNVHGLPAESDKQNDTTQFIAARR